MPTIKNKFILNVILIFSIFALITAYFIQYILGHDPCKLCLIERIPYLAAIIFISLIFILNKYEKLISLIMALFFVFGAIISFYHFGIEQGFFNESLVCQIKALTSNTSPSKLLEQLENNKYKSCKNVDFKIFGLSLATLNLFISLFLSIITMKNILKNEKNK